MPSKYDSVVLKCAVIAVKLFVVNKHENAAHIEILRPARLLYLGNSYEINCMSLYLDQENSF